MQEKWESCSEKCPLGTLMKGHFCPLKNVPDGHFFQCCNLCKLWYNKDIKIEGEEAI